MSSIELVRIGEVEFYVEVAEQGPVSVDAAGGPFSFDGVRTAIEAVGAEMAEAWERVRPAEASVEFSVKVTAKSGKLTALIVDGGGEATLAVKLTWKSPPVPLATGSK